MAILNFAKMAIINVICFVFDTYFELHVVTSLGVFLGGIQFTQKNVIGCYLSSFGTVSLIKVKLVFLKTQIHLALI